MLEFIFWTLMLQQLKFLYRFSYYDIFEIDLVILMQDNLVTLCYLYFQKLEWRGVTYLFNVNKKAGF